MQPHNATSAVLAAVVLSSIVVRPKDDSLLLGAIDADACNGGGAETAAAAAPLDGPPPKLEEDATSLKLPDLHHAVCWEQQQQSRPLRQRDECLLPVLRLTIVRKQCKSDVDDLGGVGDGLVKLDEDAGEGSATTQEQQQPRPSGRPLLLSTQQQQQQEPSARRALDWC